MKKISVIIPVYNSESFLKRCLTSVTTQSHSNLEIIIINDGSTDQSLEICRYFAGKDERIILINQKNKGVSSARNKGLEIATGNYIGFVDSDDYISRKMYEKLLKSLISSDSDVAESSYLITDSTYQLINKHILKETILTNSSQCSHNFLLRINGTHYLWNKLYKKEILKDIYFSEYTIGEDYLFNAQIMYACNKKVTISDYCYYYVRNRNSITMKSSYEKEYDRIAAGKDVVSFYEKNRPDQANLAKLYILQFVLYLYNILLNNTFKDAEQEKENLKNEFKLYYLSAKKELFQLKDIKLILNIKIFNISPNLYSFLKKTRSIFYT